MMKRIISLILVVVLSVLALASCGYKYSRDDMSKYVKIDKAKLLAALETLEITDGDFGTDETKRWEKVADKIFKDLASAAGSTQVKDGTVGQHDKLSYCYYATVEVDGVTHILFADKMTESKSTTIQLGLNDITDLKYDFNKEFYAAINELMVGKTLNKDNVYSTVTVLPATDDVNTTDVDETKLNAGNTVYVSYTYKADTLNEAGEVVSSTADVTVAYKKVEIKADDAFTSQLIGKTVSSTALSERYYPLAC